MFITSPHTGLANFLFGIPAVGTIDTFGRRRWLLVTIPGMALALMAAAVSLEHENAFTRRNLVLVFMLGEKFCSLLSSSTGPRCRDTFSLSNYRLVVHTAFYSPAMGPVPFTLASEA